jgi:hypothetical protein
VNRNCIGCGQVDDHPRHIITLPDGTDMPWHHDCHARATGDPVSVAVAEAGLTGDELRRHIEENNPGGEAARARNEQTLEES